ncbi:hypothetical protein [Paraglaciecola sp. L3A3]|uniref:hypothetical protein n=1 Tax=Paraglaciecola sp. L3A3 TaxID=2686358 RepID=UPI00131D4AB4|nr:hypothetical protein [Paraglaciecola sp. L3A3]
MKKFIAALTLLIGLSANANTISIQLSDTDINLGETVQVSLLATGFEMFDTFDFDLEFDTSTFSYDPTTLVSDVADTLPLIFEVNDAANGMAFSFFEPMAFAGGDFLLASFSLTATDIGDIGFSLADSVFADSLFQSELTVDTTARSQISVTEQVAVSAPATVGILAMSMLLMLVRSRKTS